MLSYSTLWAISALESIHSASAAKWITAWTDPSLSPPPLFIFLPLTFIEAFQRNSPLAIHFLKWSYREKAYGVCVCVYVCLIINESECTFLFFSVFFSLIQLLVLLLFTHLSFLSVSVYLPLYFFPLLTPALSSPSISHPPVSVLPLSPPLSQGGCTTSWTSTPMLCARTAARPGPTSASTVLSTRRSPPPHPPTPPTPPRILGCRP